ncbi:MAG: 6,7-dimethyl-8-ribityllumazine synthase [Elusimicrobiota bacterium]
MKQPRFGIVVSRFNEEITGKLHANCVRALKKKGVAGNRIHTVWVPGGFEIPWAAQELARSGRFDAVICLGAVLKGQTPQNDYISNATYIHIQRISLQTRVPCVVGVITPKTYAQAVARTRGKFDRGAEAALAALEMARLKIHGAVKKG